MTWDLVCEISRYRSEPRCSRDQETVLSQLDDPTQVDVLLCVWWATRAVLRVELVAHTKHFAVCICVSQLLLDTGIAFVDKEFVSSRKIVSFNSGL